MIIKNGLIYDGKGGKPFRADLRITGEKISEIGENLSQSGADEVVINARDRAVTPGFDYSGRSAHALKRVQRMGIAV